MLIDYGEAVRRMWAYLDRELAAKPVAEFEAIAGMPALLQQARFSRHLRELVADTDAAPPLPPELRSRVETLLADAEDADGGTA